MAVTGRVRAGIIDVHAHWLPRELLSLPPGLYETPPHPATQPVPLRPGMLTAGGTSTAFQLARPDAVAQLALCAAVTPPPAVPRT